MQGRAYASFYNEVKQSNKINSYVSRGWINWISDLSIVLFHSLAISSSIFPNSFNDPAITRKCQTLSKLVYS